MKDYSPEERLLRLIKGKHKKGIIAPGETNFGKEKETPKAKPSASEEVKNPVKSLPNKSYLYILTGTALLIILAVFVFNSFFGKETRELSDMESLIASLAQEAKTLKSEEVVKEKLPEKPQEPKYKASFSEYQKLLNEKSIFTPSSAEKGSSAASAGEGARDIIKDLKLVGIVPGPEPQAIIEDKGTQQTLFLKKGEYIRNIEIKDISNGRVILSYGNETITLSL